MEKINSILRDPTTWAILASVLAMVFGGQFGLSQEQIYLVLAQVGTWVTGEAIRPTQLGVEDLKKYLESRRLLLSGVGLAVTLLQQKTGLSIETCQVIALGLAAIVVKQSLQSTEKPKFKSV